MRILIIDNYDSFIYNLVQYVGELGGEPMVFRNDALTLARARRLAPRGIIISPGPGNPAYKRYFGICAELIRTLSKTIPTLGVCLGHQGIGVVFGATLVRSRVIFHGRASLVEHDGKGVLRDLPSPIVAGRYHSLVISRKQFPKSELEITSWTPGDNVIMGIRHRRYPIEGLQFHPESVLTPYGKRIVSNFLNWCEARGS